MRVFLATGEASGDMLAAALVTRMADFEPGITFAGIGGERMAAAGVRMTARTTGWGTMGPLEAARVIPELIYVFFRHLVWLLFAPWDLIVLVDFGAFNVRLAKMLRTYGYRGRIVYLLPPGAWLDIESQSRTVARTTVPLTAFAHQRDFYRSHGLEIAYFGHPLVSLIEPRAPREPAPARGGCVALLPGSRRAEIARMLPRLLAAAVLVRERRPEATFVVSAADADADARVRAELERTPLAGTRVVRGARAALDVADAAWIASGTAVLEATLREVPAVALYVIAPAQVAIGRRMWRGRYVTLPNIIMDREIVPELLQDDATPQALCDALLARLEDPAAQVREMRSVRAELGSGDPLARCAAFAVAAAR